MANQTKVKLLRQKTSVLLIVSIIMACGVVNVLAGLEFSNYNPWPTKESMSNKKNSDESGSSSNSGSGSASGYGIGIGDAERGSSSSAVSAPGYGAGSGSGYGSGPTGGYGFGSGSGSGGGANPTAKTEANRKLYGPQTDDEMERGYPRHQKARKHSKSQAFPGSVSGKA